MDAPRTRYVRNGDANIAYQVTGEGPVDLVFVPGWFSHLDHMWQARMSREFLEGLARFARLVIYDKRGTGLSDPLDRAGSYEDRIDDLRAVMEAAGVEDPVVCGLSEGGILAALYAAANPSSVRSLILLNMLPAPAAMPDAEAVRQTVADGWGEGALFDRLLPEARHVPGAREGFARVERHSSSRGLALEYFDQICRLDVRPALPAVSVPTLVLRGVLDQLVTAEDARETAAAIPGAQLREVPCGHLPWIVGRDEVVAAIEAFATGATPARSARRKLATVMFTDIVESTQRATALGDREWHALLDRHDEAVREDVERFGGREVKTTGDGFFVAFDGPTDAIDCARASRERTRDLGIETRAGIHMGQCEVRGDDLAGIAVHIGARIASLAGPGEILVSRTVRDLVAGSDIELEDRGEHVLKGVPDAWRVFAVA